MAVYKVIQDIESEDKLLGPLGFKGLVYAIIVGLCLFLDFKLLTTNFLGIFRWVLIILLLLPASLFGILASPLGREQPTEVWLLSKIRFMLQSRKRLWNQSGITNLVTITAPKKIEAILTKNFTQTEVKSRLSALANTLDSRGWAVKNVNINMSPVENYYRKSQEAEDRLVDTNNFVQEVPTIEVHAADDILDVQNNPTAQNFQSLMIQADVNRRQALQEKLAAVRAAPEYLGVAPKKDPNNKMIGNVKPLSGFGANAKPITAANASPSKELHRVTEPVRADKLELAQSGNDLSVASISKLADRNLPIQGEVAIALH